MLSNDSMGADSKGTPMPVIVIDLVGYAVAILMAAGVVVLAFILDGGEDD